MNRFAVVMTCTQGLIENVTAAFNGIELYGNEVDVHLISKDMDEGYLNNLPSNYIVVPWNSVCDADRHEYSNKNSGWEVRFYRYAYVSKIKNDYDAVMILDADVFVCGNFMGHFDRSFKEGVLIMPDNPWGNSVDKATLDNVRGASSPPFHCHPNFFDPKKYDWLMREVYDWGKKEDFGDMATLYRTLLRNDSVDKVKPISNDLYCFTNWHKGLIECNQSPEGLPELYYKGERMVVVHRRWAMPKVRRKFVSDLKGELDIRFGTSNVSVFADTIRILNEKGPIKWEPYTSDKVKGEWQ